MTYVRTSMSILLYSYKANSFYIVFMMIWRIVLILGICEDLWGFCFICHWYFFFYNRRHLASSDVFFCQFNCRRHSFQLFTMCKLLKKKYKKKLYDLLNDYLINNFNCWYSCSYILKMIFIYLYIHIKLIASLFLFQDGPVC